MVVVQEGEGGERVQTCEIGTAHTERTGASHLAEPILAADAEIESVSGTFCHGCSAGR